MILFLSHTHSWCLEVIISVRQRFDFLTVFHFDGLGWKIIHHDKLSSAIVIIYRFAGSTATVKETLVIETRLETRLESIAHRSTYLPPSGRGCELPSVKMNLSLLIIKHQRRKYSVNATRVARRVNPLELGHVQIHPDAKQMSRHSVPFLFQSICEAHVYTFQLLKNLT